MQPVLLCRIMRLKATTVWWNYLLLFITLLALIFISLLLGRYPITPEQIVGILKAELFFSDRAVPDTVSTVFMEIRLPRIIAALLIGAALSVSGAVYQGTFKNPMVSPDILGASAGAGFGAALAILCSWGMKGIHIASFVCGLLAVFLTYFISTRIKSGDSSLILVLTGIFVGTVFSSLISLFKAVADPYNKLPAITYWLMGSLVSIKWSSIKLMILPVLTSSIVLYLVRWHLNIISFGDEEAQALGVDTGKLRIIVILCATLLTTSAVSVSGMIGWVGLVIPHLARALIGPDYQNLLPVSILVGGSFLLLVDTMARSLLPMEIPLGILTSLIGAPFFLYLLTKTRKGWR